MWLAREQNRADFDTGLKYDSPPLNDKTIRCAGNTEIGQGKIPEQQQRVKSYNWLESKTILAREPLVNEATLVLQNMPPEEDQVRKWQCMACGFVYAEELGLPTDGIMPGTSWDEIPDDWICPDCGVGKEDFEMVEI